MDWGEFSVYERLGFSTFNDSQRVEDNFAALTRSLTIVKALEMLGVLNHCGKLEKKEVSIHLVGADYVEATDPAAVFKPLSKLLALNGIRRLDILLNGPNVDRSKHGREDHLWFSCSQDASVSGNHTPTVVRYIADLYHSADTASAITEKGIKPDLIMCFNAGIWGYDSWKETILYFSTQDCPCVITSYNKEEADDDYCAVQNALEQSCSRTLWHWCPSRNMFASPASRESGIDGRKCIENCYWQAFSCKVEFVS